MLKSCVQIAQNTAQNVGWDSVPTPRCRSGQSPNLRIIRDQAVCRSFSNQSVQGTGARLHPGRSSRQLSSQFPDAFAPGYGLSIVRSVCALRQPSAMRHTLRRGERTDRPIRRPLRDRKQRTSQSCPAIISAERGGYNEVAEVVSLQPLTLSSAGRLRRSTRFLIRRDAGGANAGPPLCTVQTRCKHHETGLVAGGGKKA